MMKVETSKSFLSIADRVPVTSMLVVGTSIAGYPINSTKLIIFSDTVHVNLFAFPKWPDGSTIVTGGVPLRETHLLFNPNPLSFRQTDTTQTTQNFKMGLQRRTQLYEVGEQVSALKNQNAFQKYFPGEIVKIHERPQTDEVHWNAEKSIVLHLMVHTLTCFLFYTPKQLYDIKYEDGTVDKEVSPMNISKVSKNP